MTAFEKIQREMMEAGYDPPRHPLEMSEYLFHRFTFLYNFRNNSGELRYV